MTAFPSVIRPVARLVKQAIRLRHYQVKLENGIFSAWDAGHQNVLAVSPTGSGKCLGKGTPVMLYSGEVVPVENIRVGDMLMGPDSLPRRVLSLARGREQMYRITPRKGDPYVVNESHILSLRRTAETQGCQKAGNVVNISVREYLTKAKWWRHVHKGYRAAVDFADAPPLPLPAYIIGAWLGDGTTGKNAITTGDTEVAQEFEAYAEKMCMRTAYDYNSENSAVLFLYKKTKRFGRAGSTFGNALRELGIFNEKAITHRLKTASRKDRLELLAGIIDTDGTLGTNVYGVTLKSENLLDGVVFIARSLGFSAYKSVVKKTCTNNGVVGTYYQCTISGDTDLIPCRIPRKQATPRTQKKNVLNVGITVEPIGEDDYYGFTITGDRLFLLGDFTVTHNTVLFCSILSKHVGAAVAIAHRQELLSQLALTLNKHGIPHRIVAPDPVIRAIVDAELEAHGVTYFDPSADIGVAGANTVERIDRGKNARRFEAWRKSVTLWVNDEAAHVTADNLWGRAFLMFPNVKKGLGVTAWPGRSDGKGLGRHADGLFDFMVVGPTLPEMIEDGYLCPFKIWTVPHSVDYDAVPIGASGELVQAKLQAAEEGTQLVGNVVETYLQRVPGKRAIAFFSSIKKSQEAAEAFRAAGVPALALDGESDRDTRNNAAAKLASGEILVLTNADLYGEGNDIPAVEVVIMATRTASFQRYLQWFGRMLRLLLAGDQWAGFDDISAAERRARIAASTKPFGILIDHAGNVIYHKGPPAGPHLIPTLDRAGKRSSGAAEAVPYRVCTNRGFELVTQPHDWQQWRLAGWKDADMFAAGHVIDRGIPCMTPYTSIDRCCPECGYMPMPASRKEPEHVDGDLQLLDEETLAALWGAQADAVKDERELWDELCRKKLPHNIALRHCADHRNRVAQLGKLGEAMGMWGGLWKQRGDSNSQMQRRFYALFGYDVITAQALKRDEAEKLTAKIWQLLELDEISKPD